MRIFFTFIALLWLLELIALVIGDYHPSKFTIGMAMFITALYFLEKAMN